VQNTNTTGPNTLASLGVRNQATLEGGVRMVVTGAGFTNGGTPLPYLPPDASALVSGSLLSGGFSIIAAAGDMKFWAGATPTLAMTIPAAADRILLGLPVDVGGRVVAATEEAFRAKRVFAAPSVTRTAFASTDEIVAGASAYIAFDDRSLKSGAAAFAFQKSFQSRPILSFTGNIASCDAFSSEPTFNYTGIMTSGAGFTSEVRGHAAAAITNFRHFYVLNNNNFAGTMTNQHGLYVAPLTSGANNWGVYVQNNNSLFGGGVQINGDLILKPAGTVTPANNNELMVQATSNTQLTFKYKGTDGVVRSGNLPLA
jgi:hypothetical protein